ncbi:unnamed protein product [Cyberlindnera jadinii]|uniref:Mitochondrial carrier n=1 Tax=Cyberlindnera jadinii (strain ATCC 18201 / CBS 1600 / BCRC 20928 / JCM 3617 / NBRC 0987 / NRRL Y-1542) TaxID=983966 RepID=A0A0H5C183_CYBJN|nr:unnamed protein product [Cyberlindnera jadinii]
MHLDRCSDKTLQLPYWQGERRGIVSRTVIAPVERAKILFQLQGPGKANYQGMFPTIAKMYKEEGVKGLFRGNGLNCVRIFPYSAVQFFVYQRIKFMLLKPGEIDLNNFQRLFAGFIGGIASVFATYPLDLVRTRLSIQTANLAKLSESKVHAGQKPPGVMELLGKIYKTEGGILGLYRGVYPTTLGVAPYVAINFAVYEQLKEFVPEDSNPLIKLLLGATAGGIAQTLTYPFDLLRRRFQVLTMGGHESELGFKYTSVWNALETIVKTEGFAGLYKGLVANLFKVVPSMAVSWLTYDVIKDWMVKL